MMAAISPIELTSIVLVVAFLFLGFRILEANWSYRIGKPHAWEAAVKNGRISNRLKKIERRCRDKVRFYFFWFQIERLRRDHVPGAFAELGVYKGETAKMIHEMDPARNFHLFDTFEGFDRLDLENENSLKDDTIDFSDTSEALARKCIGGNDKLQFHKGYFPETAKNLEIEYALVHLDADLYSPTLAALQYFYPKLSKGGVIIIHDYNHTWEGVKKAVAEFMSGVPEGLAEIPDWQGSVMMVKNS